MRIHNAVVMDIASLMPYVDEKFSLETIRNRFDTSQNPYGALLEETGNMLT